MKLSHNSNLYASFIKLKDTEQLEKYRIAGKCVARIMTLLETLVREKTTMSLLEISKFAESEIIKDNCSATFKGYKNFPEAVCCSVNNQLVHGIPTDYKLRDGDLISFDFGATYKGCVGDSAVTVVYGTPKSQEHIRMINLTNECLYAGIKAIEVGKKTGVIGNAIFKTAKNKGYNVFTTLGGHGLDTDADGNGIPHAHPFIANKSSPDEGIRIQEGLTIAIEPLLTQGSNKTKILSDGWTIISDKINCHFEHTVYVHKDRVEILTLRENETCPI